MAKKLRNPLHYTEKEVLDNTEFLIIETPPKTVHPVADAIIQKIPVTLLGGGGGGSGTVTSVSVATANGVSGSVANATTTPTITLTLGAITPTSVNGATSTEVGYLIGVTSAIQTQLNAKASTSYVDGLVLGLLDDRGDYDASGDVFPSTGGSGTAGAIVKGDLWQISVQGTLGGIVRYVGESIRALVDTPGQTAANWGRIATSTGYVAENNTNKVTSVSGASTDVQYPSAKLLYDQLALKANTAGTLAQFAATTSLQLATLISDETGSGALVFATSPTLITPDLGTPSALVGTNISGTAANLTAGQATAALGLKTATTTVSVSAATAPTTGQVLTATNSTTATWQDPTGGGNVSKVGTPVDNQIGVWAGDGTIEGDTALTFDTVTDTLTTVNARLTAIELGHDSDTTITRVSTGRIAVEGINVPTISSTDTLTNKRVTLRSATITSSATPTINTDNVDYFSISELATNITSFTTNLSGTPTVGQKLRITILDDGSSRTIAWGVSFEAGAVALPTETPTGERMDVHLEWDEFNTVWRCMAVSPSAGAALELGETSTTAYRGDNGKTAYDHSQLTSGNPHNVTKSNVGLGNVTDDAQVTVSTTQTVTGRKTFKATGNYTDSTFGDTFSIIGEVAETGYAFNAHLDNGTWKHLTTGHALLVVTDVSTGHLITYYSASDTGGSTASWVEIQRISAGGVVVFQKAVRGVQTALTSSSNNIAINFDSSCDFTHTFTEDTTLANPSNLTVGQSGFIYLTQHASSPKTLAYGSYWKFIGGTPSVSNTNGAFDTLSYTVRSSTFIEAVLHKGWA